MQFDLATSVAILAQVRLSISVARHCWWLLCISVAFGLFDGEIVDGFDARDGGDGGDEQIHGSASHP